MGQFFPHLHIHIPILHFEKKFLMFVLIKSLLVGNKKRKIFDCQMFLKFVNVSISNLMSRSCKPLKKKKYRTKICSIWKVWCWECIHFRIWFKEDTPFNKRSPTSAQNSVSILQLLLFQCSIKCVTLLDCRCEGGFPSAAWSYYKKDGLVTGGQYNSHQVRSQPLLYYIPWVNLI